MRQQFSGNRCRERRDDVRPGLVPAPRARRQARGPRNARCRHADLAASALLAAVAYGLYVALDALVGRSLPGQIISVCGALTAGLTAYAVAVLALRVPEAEQIRTAITARIRRH